MTLQPGVVIVHLRVVGMVMAVLAAINLFVPRRFRWRQEMARLSLINRQIFLVHSFFIVLTLTLFSALLLSCSGALLVPTRLSRAVLAGLAVFWTARALAQWFYYSPELWRGNRFNTVMHWFFSALWIYITTTFLAALWINLGLSQ